MRQNRRILAVIGGLLFLICLVSCTRVETPGKEEPYTLTSAEKAYVEKILMVRESWESLSGVGYDCCQVRFSEKNGTTLFKCGYSSGSSGAMVEKTYYFDGSGRFREYVGLTETGLVSGTVCAYGRSYTEDQKMEALGKALTGKSDVIIPSGAVSGSTEKDFSFAP